MEQPVVGFTTRPTTPGPEPPVGRDIDVAIPRHAFPVSRGARERRLERSDRYDRRAVVTGHETLTPTGTVRISFRVVDEQSFPSVPGYFIGIRADVPGAGLRRTPYCLTTPSEEERGFRLLVRLVPEGPLSRYLAALDVGDEINFRGPSGRCMIPKEDDAELILLATGVGLSPLVFLVRELRAKSYPHPVHLFWGLRLVEDICLLDELDELVRTYPGFSYDISLSQPPPGWTGLRGRITESVPPLLGGLAGKRYYLVGNGAMIEEMATALSDLGVDKTFIYEEAFFNGRHKADPAAVAAIRDRFVACDLFSPHKHQEAGLFHLDRPLQRRR